ncbi:NAD-dependent epimerase/dehydratase family protein [Nocardioides solisilvae]|uniref:NAD-dependent epimerase/dehydratase family protein n=1 Tax=Nocardioides solisilvae TaxID=1542435 RepID=UPI000D74D9A3|nr:NAD-dependent epimerase/dehydratase family protein [Nocardioides solisilvae]
MDVVVTGATGNIGTAVVERLLAAPEVTRVRGVARRLLLDEEARRPGERVEWHEADVRTDDLAGLVRGADCVVHLAWMFNPTHHPETTWETNAVGTARVLEAVAAAGVPHVVAASSIAAYSPRVDLDPVEESWPTHGTSAASYCREKAYVERLLDAAEAGTGAVVARLRPAFVFQRRAASEQRRIFGGPLAPQRLVRPALVPVLPFPADVPFQAIHAADLADAVARVVVRRAGGPFNLAADEVVGAEQLAEVFEARHVPVPKAVLRGLIAGGWKARALPADPRLFDALSRLPVMSTARARRELDWRPRLTGPEAVADLVAGMAEGAGFGTAPLHAS